MVERQCITTGLSHFSTCVVGSVRRKGEVYGEMCNKDIGLILDDERYGKKNMFGVSLQEVSRAESIFLFKQ